VPAGCDTFALRAGTIRSDTYSHAIPATQEEAAAKIAALVFTTLDEGSGEEKDLQQPS